MTDGEVKTLWLSDISIKRARVLNSFLHVCFSFVTVSILPQPVDSIVCLLLVCHSCQGFFASSVIRVVFLTRSTFIRVFFRSNSRLRCGVCVDTLTL